MYKIKFIEENKSSIYFIKSDEKLFTDILTTLKKQGCDIPKENIYSFNDKKLTKNDILDQCGFSWNNINIINIKKETSLFTEEKKKLSSKSKKKIGTPLRKKVWDTYVGRKIGVAKCHCCNTDEISQSNFACGHVKSEHDGGDLDIENLRPICTTCNSAMGTCNMIEYMKEQGLGELINKKSNKELSKKNKYNKNINNSDSNNTSEDNLSDNDSDDNSKDSNSSNEYKRNIKS